MICSDKELSILLRHREALASQLTQVDALIASATQRESQPNVQHTAQTAKKPVDPIVMQRLATDAEADRIIGYWERTTGYKCPHNLVVAWIEEHGRELVITICNQMLAKHSTKKLDPDHQRNYVAAVLRDSRPKTKTTPSQIVI